MLVIDVDLEINLSLIQIYAPTYDSDILDKGELYVQLQNVMNRGISKRRMILLSGDFNGRIGQDERLAHGSLVKYGGERALSESGRRLIEFYIENQLLVGNSFYPHKKVHKITYEAEGTGAKSVIDYFIYPQDIRDSILDVKVIRGAELCTDHWLLVMDTRFKRPARPRTKRLEVTKIKEFQNPEIQREYEGKLLL